MEGWRTKLEIPQKNIFLLNASRRIQTPALSLCRLGQRRTPARPPVTPVGSPPASERITPARHPVSPAATSPADPSPLHGFDSVPRRRLVLTEDEREKLDLEMVPHWVTDTLDDTPLDADPPVVYQPLNIFPEVVTHQFFSVVAKPL